MSHHHQKGAEQDQPHNAAEPHHPHFPEHNTLTLRVVVIAVQNKALDGRDRTTLGGIKQPYPYNRGLVLDTIQVAGNPSLWIRSIVTAG
jgi:hypothetical protein